MAEPPLTLRISARKARTLAGESIVLDVAHEVRARLKMETVHLNRDRTVVLVRAEEGTDWRTRALTGNDYALLHRHRPLTPIGSAFVAEPGDAWTSQLDLFRFTRPLPAGRYSIELTYRWGSGAGDVVRTEPVAIEVVPATVATVEDRWLAGAGPRDRLATLWTAESDGGTRWLYQAATGHDPSVVEAAADLDMPGVAALTAPRAAHLNDIASAQFARHVVWREAGGMGCVKVSPRGRAGDPAVVPLRLAPGTAPRLADPPLQSRAGALHAIWVGADGEGRATACWVDVADESNQRTFPIGDPAPLAAVVGWGRTEDPLEATMIVAEPADAGRVRARAVRLPDGAQEVLYEGPGEFVDLLVDQWAGAGTACLLLRVPRGPDDAAEELPRLEIVRWSFEEGAVSKSSVSALPPGLGTSPRAQWRHAAALPGGDGLALLFEGEDGWTAWSNGASVAIPRPKGAVARSPRLVATARDGVYFVFHEEARGFSALSVFPRSDASR